MEVFMQVKDLNLEGNIIDNGWIENLKYENGKTNMNAVMILSEIVYWYKPTLIKDETTGKIKGYKKKFKLDKLQKNYEDLGERFGLTKRQAKLAIKYLVDKKIITIEFRTIEIKNKRLNNVLFIEPIFDNLKAITGIHRVINENTDIINEKLKNKNKFKKEIKSKEIKNNKIKYEENLDDTKSDSEQLEIIHKKFDKIGAIKKNKIKELINKYGIEKINYYLDNYNKFKTDKHNPIGFILKAIEKNYDIPLEEKNNYIKNNKPIQSSNFEQRVYNDDYFDGLYDNF